MNRIKKNINPDLILFLLSLAAFIYVLYFRRNLCFSFSTDLEGIEAFQIILLQLTNLFGSPYTDVARPPCLAVPYAPLYYEFVNLFMVKLDMDPVNDIHRIYTMARQLNLLVNLLNVALIFFIARLLSLPVLRAATAALLFFLLLTFHNYAVRPDSIKLLLISASLYTILRAVLFERFRNINLCLTGFMVCVAIMVKQDAIQVLLAYTIYILVINRELRSRFIYLVAGGVVTALMVGGYLLMDGTEISVILNSITSGIGSGFEWSMYLFLIITHYYIPFSPAIVFSGFLCYRYYRSGKRIASTDLLIVLFACLGVCSSIFALKMGSTPLYFMEFNMIMLLLIPVLMVPVRLERIVVVMVLLFLLIKLISITRYYRVQMSGSLETEFYEIKEAAEGLGDQLPGDYKVFAFNQAMNSFMIDRMAASNLGYELLTYAFYRKNIYLDIKSYKIVDDCGPDGIIMINDSISVNYMKDYHPNLEISYSFNNYVIYGTNREVFRP